MLRGSRIVFLVMACALVLAPSAGGRAADTDGTPAEQYWLGAYFAGMRLTHISESAGSPDKSFSYGDCEFPQGEGGCSVPAQVQNSSSCARNPIGLDRLPFEVYLVRGGGLAAVYESTGIDVGTGGRTVTVYADYELMGAALREVRPEGDPDPQPLAPPVYPTPVLRELKRVTVAARRFDEVGEIAKAIHLPAAEVRLRLRIAELLGPDALVGVRPPTMSTETVERLRQVAFRAQYDPARYARRHGISKASLEKKLNKVRGLTGDC
jgi:hypothetical protein